MINKPEHYKAKTDLVDLLIKWRISSARVYYSSSIVFGNGADGDLYLNSIAHLGRDMYYRNLTIGPKGQIHTNGYRVSVNGFLDMTQASSKAIKH